MENYIKNLKKHTNFNISILSFISYVSGKCPAGCPPKIISLWRTARMNERRSVRKDVHTENDLK